jgi:tRNA(Ile)-lysidine synthase
VAPTGRGRLRRPPAVARVLERITATVRRHEMFLPGQRVLVAVSGGPDSVCLLYALWSLRRLFRIRIEVFHFDHRLRADSASDAAYVARLAERLGLPFHLIVAEGRPPDGASVEAWARERRMVAGAYLARDVDAAGIATAHTRDDQAETVLMAALSGSGLDRLRGIDPNVGPVVRPLLDVSREEVEAFCRALHLRPRRDPTNADTNLLRNAIRLRGIPALERATRRGVREPLARTADLVREDARELARQALEAWDDVCEEIPDGIRIDATRLGALPTAIAIRVIALAIVRCGVPKTEDSVVAVLDLANGRAGRRRDLVAGLKAVRDREYVSLSRSSPESRV